MTKVKPKLYLNMSPETVEEGGLVFARNMKIDDDGHLTSDYGYKNISTVVGSTDLLAGRTIVGHIVGLDNKIYLFTQKYLSPGFEYRIFEYDEVRRNIVDTGVRKWTWGGGTIYGCVSTNVSGEKILTIGEEKHANAVTPLKHINLSNGYYNVADESFYTQAPACPTANLILKNTYVKTIPNGVYVFFIRYRIRKDVYTNWFICSRPIFGGTSEKINTIQGGLQYINLHKDAAKSFVFQLTFPVSTNKSHYDKFQLGFIITHDDAVDARVWKSFSTSGFVTGTPSTSQNLIYFDYEDVKEANIDDLLANTYELYNVKNITNFKNKLYISNYKESDFNPDLSSLASGIKLYLEHSGESATFARNMTYKGRSLNYNYQKGYFDSHGSGSSIRPLFDYSDFIFDISDLSKVSTKEKENVVTFNLSWDSRANPDVALVNNVKNNLWYKVIFGQDYDSGAPTDYTDAAQLQRVGLKMLENSEGSWAVYAPLNVDRYYGNHPFYNEGFTFAFGSLGVGNTTNRKVTKFNAYDYLYRKIGTDTNKGWFSIDGGFSKEAMAVAEETLRSEIESRSFFAKCYFKITSGANVYTIGHRSEMDLDNFAGFAMNFNYIQESGGSYVINSDYLTDSYKYYNDGYNGLEILDPAYASSSMDDEFKRDIKVWVVDSVIKSTYFEGIDENGSIILKIDGDLITATSIEVCFKKFDFSVDIESVAEEEINSDKVIVKKIKVSLKTTDYVSLCSVGIKNNLISTSYNSGAIEQKSTLMPYSVYQAYVHFVDSHNIVTNGIPLQRIPSSGTTGAASSNGDVISLKYTNSNGANDTYKSFFISLVNIGDIVMEGFGWQKSPTDATFNILHCLELDAMLYNINENITIKIVTGSSETTITNAKYYSSGESTPSIAFGNCGFIGWYGSSSDNYTSSKFYIIISRNKNTEELNSLTKASGYIPINPTSGALPLPDGYYGSWLCLVKKPSFALSSSCYVVGKDVYATKRTATFKLVDFDNYIQIQNSPTYCIRSNYNLNYLSLTEDISDSIFSVGKASSGVKQIAKVINSAILSYIYELRGMYKDFSNKYFRQIDTDNRTEFDNTIRVSNVLSDETFNNAVFKFTAEDYYNVPTDRGIIVSLFSIGSNIYVHTKGSLYKFDANQTIMASDTDIKLQESEPFSAGITQIIDSQYGYGGIDNKEAGCVTFDSYFFYDKYSTHIFAYGGNNQVQLIDASIYKLLKYYSPEVCITLHDDINHRVLFMFGEGTHMEIFFTISYNYKSKTFVSIHDLDLANTFAGRTRCFSYNGKNLSTTGNFCELFNKDIDWSTIEPIIEDLNIRPIYGDATWFSNILTQSVQSSMFNIAVVMFPSNALREVINFVKYIGEIVENYVVEGQDYDLILIPKHNNVNPVKSLQIVTDTCLSNIVDTTVDDTVRPDHSLTDHKGFKHEVDSWNTNYFRNILNIDNVYNYPGETDEGGPGQPRVNYRKTDNTIATAHPNSDNHSLVYGKYYVLLFNFKDDVPIKFEEVFINSEKY